MSNVLTELLFDIIISILQDEQHLKSKSIAALKYVKKNHDVCRNIKILEEVYHAF